MIQQHFMDLKIEFGVSCIWFCEKSNFFATKAAELKLQTCCAKQFVPEHVRLKVCWQDAKTKNTHLDHKRRIHICQPEQFVLARVELQVCLCNCETLS